jgi:hypothetical protein
MLTDIKYLKYIKCLGWSYKVEAGSAVFMMTRSVFLLLGSANLEVVIFYHIWTPVLCPLLLMHVLLCRLVGLRYMCFLELHMSIVLCVFAHVQGWLSVFLYHCICSFFTLCGSSHMYWSHLLTCCVVERRVDVLCHGYGWFPEWINAVVDCSQSLM